MSNPLPWTPDHELTAEQVRTALRDALPGATLGDVAFVGAGWDNFAYEIEVDGARWIYRFPKRADRVPHLLREVDVLDVIRSHVSAPVPRARGPYTSSTVPYPFAGYPRLPGVQLQQRAPDWPHAGRVAAQLATFLTALHAIPRSAYDGIAVPEDPAKGSTAHRREKALTSLDLIADTLPASLVRDVRAAVAIDVADAPTSCGIHCDLGDDHILTDEDGRLTGVIDWADFSMASPHGDIVGGTIAFGDAFLLPALAAYDRPMDADFEKRIRLSAVSVMVWCIDLGSRDTEAEWTAWIHARLPDRVAELLR